MHLAPRVAGLTVGSLKRLAEARVLAASFRRHHSGSPFFAVFTDHQWLVDALGTTQPSPEGVHELSVHALGIQHILPHRMLFEWDEIGMQRIAVFAAADALFDANPALEVLVVLAPWAHIHAPLDALVEQVTASGAWAIVPKRLGPIAAAAHTDPFAGRLRQVGVPPVGRIPSLEVDLLQHGVHTPDVMLLHRAAHEQREWMTSRLMKSAMHPVLGDAGLPDGRVLDRWLDAAAVLFPTGTIRHRGVGVAPWNLDERPLSRRPDGSISVGADSLLVSLHADFDDRTPWLLRPDQAQRAPGTLNDEGVAQDLWHTWIKDVKLQAAAQTAPSVFEGDRLAAGVRTSVQTRQVLRLHRREYGGDLPADDPFSTPAASPLDRLAWLRADAEAHIRGFGPDESLIIHQLDENLLKSRSITGQSAIRPARFKDVSLATGVDVVGHIRSANGLGAAARRLIATLRTGGVSTTSLHLPIAPSVDIVDFPIEDELRHGVLLAVMNGDVMERTRWQVGARAFDRRYVIGQWAWETESLPLEHRRGFAYVDEIWTYSTYVRDVVREVAPDHIPVEVVPIELRRPDVDPNFRRASMGLDERFMFLFVFDYRSTAARKNPAGLIEAYKMAFDESDGAQLVLKSINGHMHPDAVEEVRAAAGHRSDIALLDGFLPSRTTMSLIANCDVYASLHRSEGLGFTMAEAMLLGRPVIASAYGGNLDFMNATCAILVPTSTSTAASAEPPYSLGSRWADPDLESAARSMQVLANDHGLRHCLGIAARERVGKALSFQSSFSAMRRHLERQGVA